MNKTDIEKLTSDQWIERCADRFQLVAGMLRPEAVEQGMMCLEFLEWDTSSCPAQAADEEMSYWID